MNSLNKNENTKLNCLEFSETNMKDQGIFIIIGIDYIARGIETNNTIEYLSLPRNCLSTIKPLLDVIRIHILNDVELESFRVKEKEREALIQRNAKAKNKG